MPERDKDLDSGAAKPSVGAEGDSMSGTLCAGGKALIHPQRHNLKNRFELLRTLGEGTYGKVKLAYEKSSGEQVAIKYVKKTKIRDETDLNRIRREISILSSLRHDHIVNIRQVFEKKDRIVLVMDCALGGELYDHLNNHRYLAEDNTRRLFRQIVSAVHYMHQNAIVHRDLKLENIILDSDGNVKIADFGLANYYSFDQTLKTFCGSPLYASPEIVNGRPYHGPEVDIWSLGVVLYTLAYGAMPFENTNLKSLRQQISSGLYVEPAKPCGAAGLIRHMLTVAPTRRATMPDILNHWWVNLTHDLTPDGRHYDPVPSPAGRTSHRSQGSFSSDSHVGHNIFRQHNVFPPLEDSSRPSALHHVPGARYNKKVQNFDKEDVVFDINSKVPSSETLNVVSTTTEGDCVIKNQVENLTLPLRQLSSSDHENEMPVSCLTKTDNNANHQVAVVDNSPIIYRKAAQLDNLDHKVTDLGLYAHVNNRDSAQLDNVDCHQLEGEGETCIMDDRPEGLDNDKTASVFDSDRKPIRGILKRKGKFSGGDSGCCMPEDGGQRCGEEECGLVSSLHPLNESPPCALPLPSLPSLKSPPTQLDSTADLVQDSTGAKHMTEETQVSLSTATSYSSKQSLCPIHHGQVPITSSTPAPPTSQPGTASQPSGVSHPESSPIPLPGQGSETLVSELVTQGQPSSVSMEFPPPGAVCTCTVDFDLTKVVPRRKGILKNSANRNSLLDEARKRLSVGSMSSNSSVDILDLSYDSNDGEQFMTRCRSSSVASNGNSVSLEPRDRTSFCLDGEFTALNLDRMVGGSLPDVHFEDSLMEFSEARQVLQQGLALLHSPQDRGSSP